MIISSVDLPLGPYYAVFHWKTLVSVALGKLQRNHIEVKAAIEGNRSQGGAAASVGLTC